MSAKAVEAAMQDAAKCVTKIHRECGYAGLREANGDKSWEEMAQALFPAHGVLNFKAGIKAGREPLPPEDRDSYVLAFVTAAKCVAEGILDAN